MSIWKNHKDQIISKIKEALILKLKGTDLKDQLLKSDEIPVQHFDYTKHEIIFDTLDIENPHELELLD